MRRLQNFIGGAFSDAEDGPVAPLINPSTGEQFAEAPVSGQADVDRAVRAAADAFSSWKRTTPSERSLALFRIADALESQFTEIAENQPQLLARHCSEAGLTEKAAGLWGKAGQRSLEHSALVEAVEQLTRAIGLIAA